MALWTRRAALIAADLIVLLVIGATVAWLSGIEALPVTVRANLVWYVVGGAVLFVAAGAVFGLYRRMWRYASLRDVAAIVPATAAPGLVLLFVEAIPPAERLLYWLLATAGIGSIRFARRLARELGARKPHPSPQRVLVAGAGEAGAELARELLRRQELGLLPAGFVDDDPGKQGLVVYGLQVHGPCSSIGRVASRLRAEQVVIAMPSAPGPVIRQILTETAGEHLEVRILPPSLERSSGRGLVNQLRSVSLEDLLGRPEVAFDTQSAERLIAGNTVLITGAGGSIGSELCRQVAGLHPAVLVMVGHGENSLFMAHVEMQERYPDLTMYPLVGDVQDAARMAAIMSTYRPAVVFHAAAHKHVPLMECNPGEAIKNNVVGTYVVAKCAAEAGTERFVLVSTDKAVNPTSVMGATKRVAELVVQGLAAMFPTVFVTVRFGNVLGSRGSVVPLFQEQIARGGPVRVTHPDATRYFMTIPEASRLVIQAAAMGRSGDLFVLDMGEPVRILDLAFDLIRLAGCKPREEIPIEFTGLRPGEKLTEELFTTEEGLQATRHLRIYQTRTALNGAVDPERLVGRFRKLAEETALSGTAIQKVLQEVTSGRGNRGEEP